MPPPPSPASDWAWFLDVDGTLIDIAPTPSAIHIPPAMPGLLSALAFRFGGAVALVSGRTLDNIRMLVAPFRPPAAGMHGLERVTAGGVVIRPSEASGLDDIRDRLRIFATAHEGVIIEDKGLTLALHYRLAPACEDSARRAVEDSVSRHPAFRMLAGKMVFEIAPAGCDKGTAVRAFMDEPPFAGRIPVFVGDDVTDEHGFAAVNDMGGVSILVGEERATAARFRLADVGACQAWLAEAAGTAWGGR